MHKTALLITILVTIVNALQLPELQPFLATLTTLLDGDNSTAHYDLVKRQSNGCLNGYNNCASIGVPGACCINTAVCSADAAGHVACCKSGSVCTGTVGPLITAGTVDGSGNVIGATTAATNAAGMGMTTTAAMATTTAQSYATAVPTTTTAAATTAGTATTTGGGGFIIAGSSVVASPNSAVGAAHLPLLIRLLSRGLALIPHW